jgi:hypothetical protein
VTAYLARAVEFVNAHALVDGLCYDAVMTMTASEMGKASAEARKKKYKIRDWSAHMKKVRKGKKLDKRS